jgi:hypothetical protein
MDKNVFYAMCGFGVKEIKSIMRRGKVAIHTIRNETPAVIYVGRGLPGVKSRLNFMTRCTEQRGGSPHHGVIGNGENRKCYYNPKNNQGSPKEILSHFHPQTVSDTI